MTDQSHSQKGKKKKVIPPKSSDQHALQQDQDLPEAMQRMKNVNYPSMKSMDFLSLQQGVGNKALQRLVAQRKLDPVEAALQRHPISDTRQGVGSEDDEIQSKPENESIQQHPISDTRRGVGSEDDEIQTQLVQRSTGFGRRGNPAPTSTRVLWGNGTRLPVQRKNGKTKAGGKGAATKTDPKSIPAGKEEGKKEEDPAIKAAEEEHTKFLAGGKKSINPYVPDKGDDFGKFEAIYDPSARTLTADMRVKFVYPDLPDPKGDTVTDKAIRDLNAIIKNLYAKTFITQVHSAWSGKFQFQNVREPKKVWGKLNPIRVKVNVHKVNTKPHYTLEGYFFKTGTANVAPNTAGPGAKFTPATTQLFKGDLDPSTQPNTGASYIAPDEIKRLKQNLPKIRFPAGSATIPDKYIPDLKYVADYLRLINRPKFIINIIGRANKTGDEAVNYTYSMQRANAVYNKLKSFGVTNHVLVPIPQGTVGATAHGSWRKVDFNVSTDPSFTNIQNTTAHEFGHMLGLDDEYVRAGDTRTHTTQKAFMMKMLGSKDYGKTKEGKLGEELTKVQNLTSASIMERGNEVRAYHYVTLWQALYDTAATIPNQPTPPFSWKDWKVVGF